MLSDWLPFFKKTLWCQADGCRLIPYISPDAQCIVTSDFMPCPDGDKTNFIVSAELRNPDGFAHVHAWFVVPGLLADRGWESYYPFLIPQALPMFPLGVYCAYLKSVNRDAFPFIAILDDLLRERHFKDITQIGIHQMTHRLTDTYTDTDTGLEAYITPPHHKQVSESISTRAPRSFSLPLPTISENSHNLNPTLNAPDPEKVPGVHISNTAIEYIDQALPSQDINNMPATVQAVQPGQQTTVSAPKSWAGVAAGSFQSIVDPPQVEASAKVAAPVETNTAVPFQRQPNGNQLRKAKRQRKAGAGANANKEVPGVIAAGTDSKEVQRQKSTSPVEDRSGTSSTGQEHTPDTPLSPVGAGMTEPKEMPIDKVLDAHWPALSPSKLPINNSKHTTVIKLPGTDGYEAPMEKSTPQDSVKVEDELPQSSAQPSLQVDPELPQPSTQNLEQVDSTPLQADSAEVKPKTKGQKKNERRRNAKQAKKLKEEEEAAVLSSATVSALAEKIETKPETMDQLDQQKKTPAINKPGKVANIVSKNPLVVKANPSAVKAVPVKAKSPLEFGSVPSSSFDPVLSEKPQELKWDVLHEEEPINAQHLQLPVFAISNNTLPTGNTEEEIQNPLIESMSTDPPPPSGLLTIPPDVKDSNQSAPKQGLVTSSSPSKNLSPPAAKEGLFPLHTECNGLNVPGPSQSLASLTPEPETLSLVDQSPKDSSMDTPFVPLEDISDSTAEKVAKVTPDDLLMMTGEVAPEEIPVGGAAHDSEVILQDPSEGSSMDVTDVILDGPRNLIEHTIESNAPQSSSDSDPAQSASQMASISGWWKDLYEYISDMTEWKFYGSEFETQVGVAGPYHVFQLLACHKEFDQNCEFNWEIPHLWGEPYPLHLQSFPTPLFFVEFGREISEILDEDTDIPRASDVGTEAEGSRVTVEVNDAGDDDSSVITNSQMIAEDLQSENDIPGAISNIPQLSRAESRSPPAKNPYYMENSVPAVPHKYNIRDNVYFFLEDGVYNTVGNHDNSQLSLAESKSAPVEEQRNVDDATPLLPPEDDVSDAIEKSDNPQVSTAESGSPLVEEHHNAKEAKTHVPHEYKGDSDHGKGDACSEHEKNDNVDSTLPHVPQVVKIQENVDNPYYGPYDIMKNVYFYMQKEDDVPDRAVIPNSDRPKDGTNSERESCEKNSPTGDSVESLDESHIESDPQGGTVVIDSNDLEGQEQLRSAIWDSRNAPTRLNHSYNVSSVTIGTSSGVNELKSVPSVKSLGTAEERNDITKSSTNAEIVKAHSENVAPSAPVEIPQEDPSRQKEDANDFVHTTGSTALWVSKRGLEVAKAATIVALIPADLAIQATISSFKVTKTTFLVGRWACVRFGPRWLGRFVGP